MQIILFQVMYHDSLLYLECARAESRHSLDIVDGAFGFLAATI